MDIDNSKELPVIVVIVDLFCAPAAAVAVRMYSTMSDRAIKGGGSQTKYTVAVSPLVVTPS